MRRQLIIGGSALLTIFLASWWTAVGQEAVKKPTPQKANGSAWGTEVTGRHYYLKAPRNGLLMNDQVEVVRCVIRYSPQSNLDTTEVREAYRAKMWFEGRSPAPPGRFRLTLDSFPTLSALNEWLTAQFSPTPLEDGFDWPPSIKLAVRYRYVALGMDKQMVELALGGLGYQVDLEKLDDGRVRETWKLQVAGDTRRIFTKRSTFMNTVTSQTSEAYGTISSFTTSLAPGGISTTGDASVTGSSRTTSSTIIQDSGFFIFSGLPPQFLNIVFTDGKVTARRTEFVK